MTIRGYIKPEELETEVYKKLSEKGITKKDYPFDPFELIRNEGIYLQETPFDNQNIKGMIVHGPNISGIMINTNRSHNSKRFIAMHELSHYWFHPHNSQTVCFEKYKEEKKGIEWQANNATAYALMPTDLITEVFNTCNANIDYMCNYFKVSKDSLVIRLKELRLVPIRPNKGKLEIQRDIEFEAMHDRWLYG